MKINSVRIFVAIDNPFIITKSDYIGIDPENCNSPVDPRPLKTIALGLNAKF